MEVRSNSPARSGQAETRKQPERKLSPQPSAGLCASRFFGADNLPADPAAVSGDLEPHLFAADRAPLIRSSFADADCTAGSAHPCGRGALVKRLLRLRFCCNPRRRTPVRYLHWVYFRITELCLSSLEIGWHLFY